MHQGPLHVAKLDVAVLARRSGKDLRCRDVVPLALEARAAHLAEEQVTQDDEGPGAHVGPGLEALACGPGLEQRLLNEVVSKITAARKRAAKRTKMRNHRSKLFLELGIGQRNRLRRSGCWLVILASFRQTRPHPLCGAAVAAR